MRLDGSDDTELIKDDFSVVSILDDYMILYRGDDYFRADLNGANIEKWL
jgi:hypothetical protein